jgi:hypothetical protein
VKGKKVLLLCVIAVAVTLSAVRIYDINRQYPDAKIVMHEVGETIPGGGTSVTVNGGELIDVAELARLAPDYEEILMDPNVVDPPYRDDQIRYLLFRVTVANDTEEAQRMSLVEMCADALIWSNGIELDLYREMNPDFASPARIELAPRQTAEIILPYQLSDVQFKEKDWAKIDEWDFDLSLSTYPTRHLVRVPT